MPKDDRRTSPPEAEALVWVKLLLANGADPKLGFKSRVPGANGSRTTLQCGPIKGAVWAKHLSVVRVIIEAGADPTQAHITDKLGSAMAAAISNGDDAEMLKVLMGSPKVPAWRRVLAVCCSLPVSKVVWSVPRCCWQQVLTHGSIKRAGHRCR